MIPRQAPQIHETYNRLRAGFNGRWLLQDDGQSLGQESNPLLGKFFNYGIAVVGIQSLYGVSNNIDATHCAQTGRNVHVMIDIGDDNTRQDLGVKFFVLNPP